MTTPPTTAPKPPLTLQRLSRRRILLFWISLPVVVFVIFAAFTLLGLAPTAQQAIDAYDYGDYAESEAHSSSLLDLNVVERYLPYFNRGDAFAAEGDYGSATTDFESALELAPLDRKCDVRLNLALAWEKFGDNYVALGYYQGAVLLYAASQAVLDAAGEECTPPENQQELDDSKQRVQQKKQNAEDQRDQQAQPQQTDGQSEQQRQLDELQRQQEQAAQEKADQDSGDRGEQNGGYGTDKPW